MFSHITVGVSDLARASDFYDAILEPLGLRQRPVTPDGGPASRCWIVPGATLPRFYAYAPFNGQPPSAGNGSMLAFLAADELAVKRAYAAGLLAGGSSEGEP
ncbi:VOC family protein, partial [Escherichia coli]|uniref:VOC family protein n=1 Tax=Escherichia coli TaxID=562 RepID=UPI002282E644